MKLPRTSSMAADALRGTEPLQRSKAGSNATPRASGNVSQRQSSASGNISMRRCQSSAIPARCRPHSIMTGMGMANDPMHKSRSHSHEPASSRYSRQQAAAMRTQELPIPPSQEGRDLSLARSVDKNDLARMYDYATWNMYERIVSARRRRLSQMDAPIQSPSQSQPSSRRTSTGTQGRSSSVDNKLNKTEGTAFVSGVNAGATKNQQPLFKTSSHDGESSTLATADETDKSSTTSSSWSRTDSPTTHPGMSTTNFAFSNFDQARATSCPPPGAKGSVLGEESFIFELDM